MGTPKHGLEKHGPGTAWHDCHSARAGPAQSSGLCLATTPARSAGPGTARLKAMHDNSMLVKSPHSYLSLNPNFHPLLSLSPSPAATRLLFLSSIFHLLPQMTGSLPPLPILWPLPAPPSAPAAAASASPRRPSGLPVPSLKPRCSALRFDRRPTALLASRAPSAVCPAGLSSHQPLPRPASCGFAGWPGPPRLTCPRAVPGPLERYVGRPGMAR
jgi:hypothetical protein